MSEEQAPYLGEAVQSGARQRIADAQAVYDHYAMVPDALVRSGEPSALTVYAALDRVARGDKTQTATAISYLAEYSHLSTRTVQKALKWLEDNEFIRVNRANPGRDMNQYFLPFREGRVVESTTDNGTESGRKYQQTNSTKRIVPKGSPKKVTKELAEAHPLVTKEEPVQEVQPTDGHMVDVFDPDSCRYLTKWEKPAKAEEPLVDDHPKIYWQDFADFHAGKPTPSSIPRWYLTLAYDTRWPVMKPTEIEDIESDFCDLWEMDLDSARPILAAEARKCFEWLQDPATGAKPTKKGKDKNVKRVWLNWILDPKKPMVSPCIAPAASAVEYYTNTEIAQHIAAGKRSMKGTPINGFVPTKEMPRS